MGREIYQSKVIEEVQRANQVEERTQPELVRKEKIVISLNKAQVELRSQVIRPQFSEHCKLGDPSPKEGGEYRSGCYSY